MTAMAVPVAADRGATPTNLPPFPGKALASRYDVLGVIVELVSDDPAIVEVIEASYGIFRIDPTSAADRPTAATLRVARTGSTWSVTGGSTGPYECSTADIAAIATLDRLVDTVQRGLHARGLIAIHSAAVATPGGILVIAGASGQGKSTLALGLAHRGFGLLSDELAIVGRDGSVMPYPRSVHVRPATLALIPGLAFLQDRPRLTLGGGSEWALTPAELRDRWGGTPPTAGPLAAVLLLEGVPGAGDAAVTPISPAIASLELTRSSWAASVDFGGTLSGLVAVASSVPCARLRSGPLDRTLDAVTEWLTGLGLAKTEIDAPRAMDPRDLARTALLETWRRDGAEARIEATGGSMLPGIRPGDRLLVGFGAQGARTGDVVLFRHGGMVVAHRVVGSPPRGRPDHQGRQRAVRDRGGRAGGPAWRGPCRGARVSWPDATRPGRAIRRHDGPLVPDGRIPHPRERPALVAHHEASHRGGRTRGPLRTLPLDLIPRFVGEGRIPRERR